MICIIIFFLINSFVHSTKYKNSIIFTIYK